MSDDLIRHDAVTIVARLKKGEITPHGLLDALGKRIAAVNGPVNALPTLCFDRARSHADRLMKLPMAARSESAILSPCGLGSEANDSQFCRRMIPATSTLNCAARSTGAACGVFAIRSSTNATICGT